MNKIVDIARSFVGYKEDPPGSNMNKFGQWFGLNGKPWCGMFVSRVYFLAGVPLGKIDFTNGFAGVATALAHFQKQGEVIPHEKVQPGDIVIFDWNGDGHADHTGIFEKDLGNGYFQAIEGNTGETNASNGGEVMVTKRLYIGAHLRTYFIHPKVVSDNEAH